MSKDFSTKLVLVIDDTAFMRRALIQDLENLGFSSANIIEAEDGKEAWDCLIESVDEDAYRGFDLVLCDWNMPKLSGYDLLRKVRKHAKLAHLPFVLITTVSEKDKIIQALALKLSGYIIKPIDQSKLKETLNSVFKD